MFGWRHSEILWLTWDKIDLKNGIVRLNPGETKNREGLWKRKEEPARRLAPAATTRTMMTAEGHSAIVEGPDAAHERLPQRARR